MALDQLQKLLSVLLVLCRSQVKALIRHLVYCLGPDLGLSYKPGPEQWGGGGSTPKNPKKPKPKMGFQTIFGFFGVFLEKGVESTYLNIPDHLRPTCFLHFFREISPGSDT